MHSLYGRKMKRTLIKGGFVASQDPDFGNRPDSDELIEDGRVAFVGQNLEAPDVEVVDATNCIVMPGFVDGHRHIWQGPLRGICADWSSSMANSAPDQCDSSI